MPSAPDRGVDGSRPAQPPLPLTGIRVLDLTHALAGPYCTMILADFGADVIKLEPPGDGDQARSWGPPFYPPRTGGAPPGTLPFGAPGESSYFLSVNRNKRSVALDLKSPAGLAAARALALASDVVVENFRPGTAERLGLGYQSLRAGRPGLVYASISGFGQDRPTLAGYDQIAQGTSGLMSVTGQADGPPTKVGVPVGDITSGMFTAHAILAALVDRNRTGSGRRVDVALNDSLLALHTYQAGRLFATGEAPLRDGNHHPTIAPYGTFETLDGFVNVAVGSDAQYQRFCEAIDAPELALDPRFATNAQRQAARRDLIPEVERRLRGRPRAEWLERFESHGIPAGPILDMAEAFDSPLARDREMKLEVEHPAAGPIGQVGAPWKLDGRSTPIRMPPPMLGQHTADILREVLGYDEEAVATATGGRRAASQPTSAGSDAGGL